MIPQLQQTPAVASSVRAYLDALSQAGFSGELQHDFGTRLITATDNSIYQVLPQAVAFPQSPADVQLALRVANEARFAHLSLTPRGGGTGTNGQSLSEGVILDCSRHLNQILEVNLEEGWVRVEPGVVLDQLNEELAPHGVFFAPNLSPSNRATLGGMISTDACGKGSRVYGRTSDHVLELQGVLSDGSLLHSRRLDPQELEVCKQAPGLSGTVFQEVDRLVTEKAEVIENTFPRLSRFLTGYNLAKVYGNDHGQFDLNYLLAGSEGTLMVLTEARLKLTPLPKSKELLVVKYERFNDALAAAQVLVASDPTAIETLDEKILTLAREDEIWLQVQEFLADEGGRPTRTVNLIEFSGATPEEVAAKVDALCEVIDRHRGEAGQASGYFRTRESAEIGALWNLRKKGVGLLGNMKGDRRPVAFLEDTAVPPEHLADYIREFQQLLEGYGLEYAMYGHVDVGCMHVRPALDLKNPREERWVRELSDAVVALVRKYGGVMWAEHGRGFRSEYTEQFFGAELYQDLRHLKAVFDPQNRLNPGKIVTPLGHPDTPATVEGPLRGQQDRQILPALRQEFEAAVTCNGNGLCFNYAPSSVMCPSWRATRDRRHSPKGRAGLMREWLRQLSVSPESDTPRGLEAWGRRIWNSWRQWRGAEDFSQEVYEAMSGCLACKACATQCPIHVDVPDFRSRFLNLYHTRYLRPLKDYLVASTEWTGQWMSRRPEISNLLLNAAPSRFALKHVGGMVDVPEFSGAPLAVALQELGVRPLQTPEPLQHLSSSERQRSAVLVPDAFTGFYESSVVADTCALLQQLGYTVWALPFRPNGKPLHVKGFSEPFRRTAQENVDFLRPFAQTKVPLFGIDPSVVLTYRDEYPKALRQPRLALEVLLPQELLLRTPERLQARRGSGGKTFRLLGHCMEKTGALRSQEEWRQVFEHLGHDLQLVPVGCCGMAGTFGHETAHQEESRTIFSQSWKPRIPQAPLERATLLATGFSCRSQVKRYEGFRPRHPAQALLSELLRTPQPSTSREADPAKAGERPSTQPAADRNVLPESLEEVNSPPSLNP